MDETEARTRLESMVAASVAPTLTVDEVDDLLDQARRADVYGIPPTFAGWTPTWAFSSAAAAGWRLKAAKVSGEFSFTSDGQTHNRNEVFEMCLKMADRYARGAVGSVPLVPKGYPYVPVDPFEETIVGNG
jgi:hypothetical protein